MMEDLPNVMADAQENSCPGIFDYDDEYNQVFLWWNPRGATCWENNARFKAIFIELEQWVEDIAWKQIEEGKITPYKGQPKKWQILDDAVYDKDQIQKIQAAADAPMPEQLDSWKAKNENRPLFAPFNNQNMAKWRDDPDYIEQSEFDPQLLGYDRDQNRKFFLERYEKPRQLQE
jgi:hypothetical protein